MGVLVWKSSEKRCDKRVERADELAKLGSKLRHDIMANKSSEDWMKRAKELYWRNRKEC